MKKNEQLSVAEYFSQQVELCGKSQAQIAKEMGFKIPNVISNIKADKTKLPLTRVGAAANALGLDPKHLMKMVIKEYFPAEKDATGMSLWSVIESTFGNIVTDNEYAIITKLRELTNDSNPSINNEASLRKLAEFAEVLKS